MGGKVYWVTGLSGAGKTTIGTALQKRLQENGIPAVLLDGDVIIYILGRENISYTREGRLIRSYQYGRMCQQLSAQGITVVCSTIAMYDEVRDWNRANITDYCEVFIDVDLDTLKKRDNRKLYSTYGKAMAGASGSDPVEIPKHPDLVIHNTYQNNAEEYVDRILALKSQPATSEDYWNKYYASEAAPTEPSDFAEFAMQYFKEGGTLFDMGCGNGRDSFYFDEKGLKVTAMDISTEAISCVKKRRSGVKAIRGDFTNTNSTMSFPFDFFYSRWTLHAVTEATQHQMTARLKTFAKPGSLLALEARTINDASYGVGEPRGKDAFTDSHFRRYIRPEELTAELEKAGYTILYSKESDDFSKRGGDAPTLLRLIARKN